MITSLLGKQKTVTVNTDGPVAIIGEKINPTGYKKLAIALQEQDFEYIQQLAISQVVAGADILDINVGVPGLDETALLPQIVELIAQVTDAPICLDSPNPEALAAALPVAPGKPLVNSVSGEKSRLENILPLVKDRGAAVIGLTMDDNGIPADPESRMFVAENILEKAARIGIPAEDVIIDPLVMSVGADSHAGIVTLETIRLIRQALGVNINLGASNVSFGLPERLIINQAFMALAIGAGATCVISDPVKLAGTVRAADLILGRDMYASRYIRYSRSLSKGK